MLIGEQSKISYLIIRSKKVEVFLLHILFLKKIYDFSISTNLKLLVKSNLSILVATRSIQNQCRSKYKFKGAWKILLICFLLFRFFNRYCYFNGLLLHHSGKNDKNLYYSKFRATYFLIFTKNKLHFQTLWIV